MLLRADLYIVTDVTKTRDAFYTSLSIIQSIRPNMLEDLNFSNTAVGTSNLACLDSA
jgi:hypothetical protein